MKCKLCNSKAVAEELCKEHFKQKREEVYLDNTDVNNLGVLKWARDMLPEYMPQATPSIHFIILMLLFSLLDPFYKNRYERQRNIISFRGSSKSTLINMIFTLYLICHNGQKMKIKNIYGQIIEVTINERFIVIASETGMSAEDFVVRMRDELTVNTNLHYFYGKEIQDAYDAIDGQMTRRAFKFKRCFVMGAGVGQQIRGKIKGAYRATFIICDDIYSENNTITEESRLKVKRWFERAVLNSIDDLLGKIVVVGTILHEDTVLVENKKAPNWKTVEFPVMPIELFDLFVREHLNVNYQKGTCRLPFQDAGLSEAEEKEKQREYFEKVQLSRDWMLAWAERIDLYFLALKYQDAVTKRSTQALYQEYFHQPVSQSMKQIKPEYFRRDDFVVYFEHGHMWFKSEAFGNEPLTMNTELGLDTATGTIDGDDAVITVAGKLSNGYEVIIETIYGKMPARDIRKRLTTEAYGKIETNEDNIETKGFIDEAIRKAIQYHAHRIKIGYAGAEKNMITLTQQLVYANYLYDIIVIGRKQEDREGTKRERIARRLAHKYQAQMIIHNKGLAKLEYQLEFLISTKEDDVADAAEVALYEMQTPSQLDMRSFHSGQREPIRWKRLAPHTLNNDWRVN